GADVRIGGNRETRLSAKRNRRPRRWTCGRRRRERTGFVVRQIPLAAFAVAIVGTPLLGSGGGISRCIHRAPGWWDCVLVSVRVRAAAVVPGACRRCRSAPALSRGWRVGE